MVQRMAVAMGCVAMLCSGRPVTAACVGDCAGDGTVAVNELVLGVNMALGRLSLQQCPIFDGNRDEQVSVNELVAAVANALAGCPFTGEYTARIDVGDGETATISLDVAPDGTATALLRVAPTADVLRPALRIDLPLLSLGGTVDLDSGEFHFSGTVSGPDGDIPIDISGTLPDRPGGTGTVTLQAGAESYSGPIAAGDGRPTPTRTPVGSTPTPTATGTPGMLPTEEPGCEGGVVSVTVSDVNGTNSLIPLGGPLELGPLRTTLSGQSFGGGTAPCHPMVGDILQRFQFAVIQISSTIEVGTPYELGLGLLAGAFDYLEGPVTNPLATRGWSAESGTLIIDSIEGMVARFRIIDAHMVPEPSFSAQTPATGTFTINGSGVATRLMRF
jgi:hypothetical protein